MWVDPVQRKALQVVAADVGAQAPSRIAPGRASVETVGSAPFLPSWWRGAVTCNRVLGTSDFRPLRMCKRAWTLDWQCPVATPVTAGRC